MFFLKTEDSPQHGGKKVLFLTHPPKVLTPNEARQLAGELIDAAESVDPSTPKAPVAEDLTPGFSNVPPRI
jgi:hypothetical protein